MVDETKPPPNWRVEATAYDDEDEPHVFRPYGSGPLSVAHLIAREEAQPYIAEALERIAAWLDDSTNDGMFEQWQIEGTQPWSHNYAAEELRKMATGRRPLPGSEGR